ELAEDLLQPDRSLVPPVPEELGIVRADEDGGPVHSAAEPGDLRPPRGDEVRRVLDRAGTRAVGLVGLLAIGVAGDAVVLEARRRALATRYERAEGILGQVESDVAMKVPVPGIARVADLRAPDLGGAVGVAAEGRHP